MILLKCAYEGANVEVVVDERHRFHLHESGQLIGGSWSVVNVAYLD